MSNIKVVKNTEKPESKEVLAEAILRIGVACEQLRKSGLNEDAIVILLNAKTKVGLNDIRIVLDGLRRLQGWYCK